MPDDMTMRDLGWLLGGCILGGLALAVAQAVTFANADLPAICSAYPTECAAAIEEASQ